MSTSDARQDRIFDERGLSTLLRLGLGAGGRPVDEVIERLEAPDSKAWLLQAAGKRPLTEVLEPGLDALRPMSPEAIEGAKGASKALIAPGVPHDDRLRGILGYFLTLAAGKSQHGRWFSSQAPEQIARDLGDLMTALPPTLQRSLWPIVR